MKWSFSHKYVFLLCIAVLGALGYFTGTFHVETDKEENLGTVMTDQNSEFEKTGKITSRLSLIHIWVAVIPRGQKRFFDGPG